MTPPYPLFGTFPKIHSVAGSFPIWMINMPHHILYRRCLCPYDDCNDHPGETMGENIGLSNFSVIWICTAVLIALFLITCFICSVHQINNTRWSLTKDRRRQRMSSFFVKIETSAMDPHCLSIHELKNSSLHLIIFSPSTKTSLTVLEWRSVTCISCIFDDQVDLLATVSKLHSGTHTNTQLEVSILTVHCSKFREIISCWNRLEMLPTKKSSNKFLSHISSAIRNLQLCSTRIDEKQHLRPGKSKQKASEWFLCQFIRHCFKVACSLA